MHFGCKQASKHSCSAFFSFLLHSFFSPSRVCFVFDPSAMKKLFCPFPPYRLSPGGGGRKRCWCALMTMFCSCSCFGMKRARWFATRDGYSGGGVDIRWVNRRGCMCVIRWQGDVGCWVMVEDEGWVGSNQAGCVCEREKGQRRHLRSFPVPSCGGRGSASYPVWSCPVWSSCSMRKGLVGGDASCWEIQHSIYDKQV